ncbi:hypothetical protein Hdeb2414_s0006g00198721 [Helianthus debilis subsp. tardiflorus]
MLRRYTFLNSKTNSFKKILCNEFKFTNKLLSHLDFCTLFMVQELKDNNFDDIVWV